MEKLFNDTLSKFQKVVAIEDRYNDNDGDTRWAVVWNGDRVNTVCVNSGFIDLGEVVVNASEEDRDNAAKWWVDNAIDTKLLEGCVVKLKRSRKAPNGVELRVLRHYKAHFDNINYREVPEQITVDVDGEAVTVSASCINEIVKGNKPWWA